MNKVSKVKAFSGRDIEFLSVPRYPPFDKGLPNVSVEDILGTQQELLLKIQSNYGLLEPIFKEMVLSIIYNYANYIHLLPATNNDHYRGAGGLFRLGLEVAFHSYQASQECVFAGNYSAERRRALEPRWQHAAFIAGLCSEIYHPLTDMIVVDGSGQQWQSYMSPLSEWLNEGNRDTYYIRWSERTADNREMSGSFVIHSIVPKNVLQYLNDCSLDIIPQLLSAVINSNKLGHDNQLQQIVRNVKIRVIDRDFKSDPASYGKLTIGVHLERYLIDAMRLLIAKGSWSCNQRKARIWYNHEGVFVVWPVAGKEIIDLLRADKLPGIPNTTESVADILISSNVIELNPADGRAIWDIYIPSQKSTLMAVKVTNPQILFETNIPAPLNDSFLPLNKRTAIEKRSDDAHGTERTNSAWMGPADDSYMESSNWPAHSDDMYAGDMHDHIVVPDIGNGPVDSGSDLEITDSLAKKLAKLSDYLSYSANRDKSLFLNNGVALTASTFELNQLDMTESMSEFQKAGLLVANGKGTNLHLLNIKGVKQNAVIIRLSSALAYGLFRPEWRSSSNCELEA